MGSVTNVLGMANIGLGAYQSYENARQKQQEAELTAQSLETQAINKELEAAEAQKIGELNQMEQRLKGRADIAGTRVGYAASGVKVDSGSALDVIADKAAWSEYERQKIAYESDLQSWGLMNDAAQLRSDAANARATGSTAFNWAGTALGAIGDTVNLLKK